MPLDIQLGQSLKPGNEAGPEDFCSLFKTGFWPFGNDKF